MLDPTQQTTFIALSLNLVKMQACSTVEQVEMIQLLLQSFYLGASHNCQNMAHAAGDGDDSLSDKTSVFIKSAPFA